MMLVLGVMGALAVGSFVALELYFRSVPYRGGMHLDKEAQALKIRRNDDPGFPYGWFRLASLREVPEGEVIRKQLCGQDYLVVRAKDDTLSAFHPYCPHNGTDLSRNGFCRNGALVCPFHEWEFSCDSGQCVRIPYGADDEPVMRHARLASPTTRMWYGSLLVWYHPEGAPPQWEPAEDKKITGAMRYLGCIDHELSCLVDDIHENSSDFAHFTYLHKNNKFPGVESHWGGYSWESQGHVGTGFIDNVLRWRDRDFLSFETTWNNHGPGIITIEAQSTLGRFVLIDTTTPRDVFSTERYIEIYSPRSISGFLGRLICRSFQYVTMQDNVVWNWKRALKNPRYTKGEKELARFRKWFQRFYIRKLPVVQARPQGATVDHGNILDALQASSAGDASQGVA